MQSPLHQLIFSEVVFRDVLLLDVACVLSVHGIYKRFEPDASLRLVHFFLLISVPCINGVSLFVFYLRGAVLAGLDSFALFYFCPVASIGIYCLSPRPPLAKHPGPVRAVNIMAKGKSRHMSNSCILSMDGPNEISACQGND